MRAEVNGFTQLHSAIEWRKRDRTKDKADKAIVPVTERDQSRRPVTLRSSIPLVRRKSYGDWLQVEAGTTTGCAGTSVATDI
jgi:hypothetical protein